MGFKSSLDEMSQTTSTQFWNDNCSIGDLSFALEHGAVGATTNPVIVGQVLEAELENYVPEIKGLIAGNPTDTEDDIAWKLNESMAVVGAKLLKPVFDRTGGMAGYISIQTNAKYYRNVDKITEQALHFKSLAPNIMVKMPVTAAGVKAIEESTYHGVNVNATVSFTVPQALAVAEAIERGMKRREAEGKDNSSLHPVCTIMVGRTDDWIKDYVNSLGITIDPLALELSGVAVFKRAYALYKERGYRVRLLAAAYRNIYHLTEFIGGDVSMTIPPPWIKKFVKSDIRVENRMDTPVNSAMLSLLQKYVPDFNRAYDTDGMKAEEFDSYGATKKTLAQFLNGYDKMVGMIRKFMV
ncbi:MAG: transaldolase family protein [Synergistaceae bacterium]|jgi:transaldolase|nr:transaldolase family protein [Synergistaceae bacterium]